MLACLLLAFVLMFNLNTDSRTVKGLFHFGHVLIFGLVALIIVRIIGNRKGRMSTGIAAWIITMILGLMMEIIQLGMKGRYFELGDLINDAIGTLSFLLFFSKFESRLKAFLIRSISVILIIIPGTNQQYQPFPQLHCS